MYKIISLLLLIPLFASAQKQDVFIKLTDVNGKQINGDATLKGFERSLQAFTTSSGGKNNVQFNFTMNITGASADLKKAMANGELLMNGQVTLLQPATGGGPKPAYIIKMEKITVLGCTESMGCNNQMTTNVTLQATRIGWIYYQPGTSTITNKYGYDTESGKAWTNF